MRPTLIQRRIFNDNEMYSILEKASNMTTQILQQYGQIGVQNHRYYILKVPIISQLFSVFLCNQMIKVKDGGNSNSKMPHKWREREYII